MSPRRRAARTGPQRAVIYIRQSRAKDDSISLENQEQLGRDYCAQHGYIVVDVQEDVVSGRKWDERPGVIEAMRMIEDDEADVIVLWKWSRLSRSRLHWAVAADRADIAGGRIESVTEPIDTSTASGRFARGVMTEYAAFQSEQIGESWREVHAHRVRNGLPPAGGDRYGYERDGATYTPHAVEAPILAELYARAANGRGANGLAKWLNVNGHLTRTGRYWQPTAVRRILDSGFAAGLIVRRAGSPNVTHPVSSEYHPGSHPAIIDMGTWERYVAKRTADRVSPSATRPYMLSGLLVCANDGTMNYSTQHIASLGRRAAILRCKAAPGMPGHTMRAEFAEAAVAAWLADLSDNPQKLREEIASFETTHAPASDHGKLRTELARIERRATALTIRHLDGDVPEAFYRATITELETQRAAIETRLREPEPVRFDADKILPLAQGFPKLIPEAQNRVLRRLVRAVEIRPPRRRGVHERDERVRVHPLWATSAVE